MDDVERQLADLHRVAVCQEPVRLHGQGLRIELVCGGRHTGRPGDLRQCQPVILMLVAGHDQGQLRSEPPDQLEQDLGVVGGVDEKRLARSGTRHQVGVVVHRAHRNLDDRRGGKGASSRGSGLDMAGVVIVDDSHGAHGIGLGWGLSVAAHSMETNYVLGRTFSFERGWDWLTA
jgi:hypothetical protein